MKVIRQVVGPIDTNSYILSEKNDTVLIDPGGNADDLISRVKETGNDLKYIICTHAHFDHTEAVEEIKRNLGGEVLMHKADKEYAEVKVDRFIEEGEIIKVGDTELKIIHTPGHTPGCFCLLGEKEIFTGDTLFMDGVGRTDLEGGDMRQLTNSLERLRTILKPGMMVYPGHGDYYENP